MVAGKPIIIDVEAEQRPDGLNLRLLSAKSVEKQARKINRQLVIFTDDKKCLDPIKQQLVIDNDSNGKVSFIIIRDSGNIEYEVALSGCYKLSSKLAGGIKALEGVVDVQFR